MSRVESWERYKAAMGYTAVGTEEVCGLAAASRRFRKRLSACAEPVQFLHIMKSYALELTGFPFIS